jgi:nucleoid-associated protein YgaU|nr:MAG TPA: cell division suppressor protein [Caudoviricetes sp.]
MKVLQNNVPANKSLIHPCSCSEKGGAAMKKIIYLFIALVLFCGWGVNASMTGDSVQYETVTVEENDTLWDIAARRTDNTRDIRKVIYDIEQFNHISNPGELVPGMTIKVPVNR